MEDLNNMCRGKTIKSVTYECYGLLIIFTDGSVLRWRGSGYEPEFMPAPRGEKVYRVVYYTMRGSMSKDFTGPDAEIEANAFYDRHVKAHPEYQHNQWSKTNITTFYR